MSMKEVCRACLCTGRTMSSLLESVVPKFISPPDSVVDLWKLFTKMLITHDDNFPDKICMECINEIQRSYSFILKCNRSNDTLKRLKIEWGEPMYPDISQIKTETIEWNGRINKDDELDAGREQFAVYIQANDSQVDPRSQDPLMAQLEEDDRIGQEHMSSKNDVSEDEVSFIQDIKQEPKLDICMLNDEFEEIEYKDYSSTEILICPACHCECQTMKSLEKHIIENHMEGQMCKICNEEFKCAAIQHCFIHLAAIQRTPKSTDIKRHECIICWKKFRGKYELTTHLPIHTGERPFKCEVCPKTFQYKSSLTVHTTCHTGERSFKCDICPKTFRVKHHLTRHLISHTGDKPFKCEICPKTFREKHHLTRHLTSHTGDRSFKCEFCPKTFRVKHHLTRHLTCHTRAQFSTAK